MSIHVEIVNGPLGKATAPSIAGAGAALVFEGIVRELEDGTRITALDYEAYEPMATRELTRLAEELSTSHGLLSITVEHSRGTVPVGQCSFRLRVLSAHRKQALAAMDEFIDRMKRDVPIWKKAVHPGSPLTR